MNIVIVPFSKSKLALLYTAALFFVLAGAWLIVDPPKTSHPLFGNPVTIFITGLASIVFFSIMGLLIFKKLFDKTPGLIISDEGVYDNASGISAGLIPWSDVVAIVETSIVKQVLMNIVVQNPQDYIDRQTSALKKRLLEANHNRHGTVISISANGLKCSHAELKSMLEKAFNEFGNK